MKSGMDIDEQKHRDETASHTLRGKKEQEKKKTPNEDDEEETETTSISRFDSFQHFSNLLVSRYFSIAAAAAAAAVDLFQGVWEWQWTTEAGARLSMTKMLMF
ncbi:hypothetical protein AKJ16_DCAP16561 [Drosera capensis]